jgi:hypothetical protein
MAELLGHKGNTFYVALGDASEGWLDLSSMLTTAITVGWSLPYWTFA